MARKRNNAGTTEAKPAEPTRWQSRIVGSAEIDPKSIKANPLNWRVHTKQQRAAVEQALEAIGWIQQPVINKRTGHLIDGHLRVERAVAAHEPRIPVLFVDLTEDEEKLALATLDPLTQLATTDPQTLDALLKGIDAPQGALGGLLEQMEKQIADALLKPASDDDKKEPTDRKVTVRVVIPVDDVQLIERAIQKTGIASRGNALLEICKAYLGNDEEREHPGAQVDLASGLAQALGVSGVSGANVHPRG